LENYRLLQERQPEIGGVLSCQRMLAFFFLFSRDTQRPLAPKGLRGNNVIFLTSTGQVAVLNPCAEFEMSSLIHTFQR